MGIVGKRRNSADLEHEGDLIQWLVALLQLSQTALGFLARRRAIGTIDVQEIAAEGAKVFELAGPLRVRRARLRMQSQQR